MKKSLNSFIEEEMILIPEGKENIRKFTDTNKWISSNYKMSIPSKGNNQTQLLEEVKISEFYMSKYVVTNQMYNLICKLENNEDLNKPKINISWIEAVEFCNLLSKHFELDPCYIVDESKTEVLLNEATDGFRLPTDAEWQYSCKADSASYQYSDIENIAWSIENSKNILQNVGRKEANSLGLYDMLGNVWEWCWDLYNPKTYDSYRVFRGGSFAEKARICGATTRRKSLVSFKIDDLGFRVARSNNKVGSLNG